MPRKYSNWLKAYMQYVDNTDPPIDFHLWSAVSVIAGTLKKNVFMQREFILYPNQYIILTGPPGIGKGGAINPASELAKKAGSVNYISDRISAEKIIDLLDRGFTSASINASGQGVLGIDRSACILSVELPTFISTSEWMLPYLCQMWDRNSFEYQMKKGSHIVKDLCVSMLGGCVPDYVRKINKENTAVVTGGFSARCMYVYASKPSKSIDWPELATSMETDLVDDLRHIGSLRGQMEFNGGRTGPTFRVYKDFKDYCRSNGKFEQAVIVNFKARAEVHMLKLAMVLSVCESDSLIIENHHLDTAIKMVEEVQSNLEKTFRFVGDNNDLAATASIMDYLEYKGKATFAEILASNYRYANEDSIRKILSTMEIMGFCKYEGRMWTCLVKNKHP